MKLKNKIAVVTGASEGIGKQIALALAKKEVNLVLVARNKKNLEKVKREISKLGSPKVVVCAGDLSKDSDVRKIVKTIGGSFKKIDILINNAGVWQKLKRVDKVTYSELENIINTNLTGLINVTRLLVPFLETQKDSVIINVSSRSGYSAQEGQSVYTASKYGVRGFTEVLAKDLKGKIRVAGIYQAGTDTKMFKKAGDVFDQGHFIKPNDLADVVVFMLSRPPQIWLQDVRVEY